MQGKVDFRERLLLPHRADGIVDILGLVDFLVVLHLGRSVLQAVRCGRKKTVELEATR